MKFLTNAPKKKARRKARFKKGSAAAKRYMASIRPHSKGGSTVAKRRRKVTRKRVVRRRVAKINPPVRKRSRRRVIGMARTHRRRYRRNPPGFGGVLRYLSPTHLFGGVVDAGEVLAGKVVVRTIPGLVGLPTTDMLGLVVQSLTAVLAGGVAHSFVSPNAGKMVLAGGLAAPLESLLKGLNIPFISANLGEDVVEIDGMQSYPQITSGVGSYPSYGEVEDYNYAQ